VNKFTQFPLVRRFVDICAIICLAGSFMFYVGECFLLGAPLASTHSTLALVDTEPSLSQTKRRASTT
jgi:hypothetical protein